MGLQTAYLAAKALRQHLEALPSSTPVPPGPQGVVLSGNFKMCHQDKSCLKTGPGRQVTIGQMAKGAKALEDGLQSLLTE
jgi:hypothetical protein